MPRLIELNVAYADNKDADVQSLLKYWASTFVPALFDQTIYSPAIAQENGEVIGADVVLKTLCISANAEDHVKFTQQYIDLSFDQISYHCGGQDQNAFIQGYRRDVLPQLRCKHKR